MARPQFFKGDYGGPLGSYDTAARLVAQAGQTQGAAMAGLGGNIAGAIEKYQLNKEKRAKEEDAAMASLSTMSPFDLQEMGQNNPKVMEAIKNALGDTAKPRDFQLVNATIAPYNAKKAAETQDKFNLLSQQLMQEQIDTSEALRGERARIKKAVESYKTQLETAKTKLISTDVAAPGAGGLTNYDEYLVANEVKINSGVLPDPYDPNSALQREETLAKIAETKKRTGEIGKPKPFVQRTIPDEPGDYIVPGVGVIRRPSMGAAPVKVGTPGEGGAGIVPPDISTDPSAQVVDPGEIIDPATAAGGDIPGWSSDMANAIGGVFGLNLFPERTEAINQLRILNQEVRPLLVKDLSRLGAVSLVEKMDAIMPIPSDNNAQLKQKMKGLVGLMETRRKDLEKIDKAVQAGQMKVDDVAKREIRSWLTRLPKQIAILKASMGVARDIPRPILNIIGEPGATEVAPPASGIESVSGAELVEILLEER